MYHINPLQQQECKSNNTRFPTLFQNKNLGKSIELLPQSSSNNSSPAPSRRSGNSPGSLDEDLLLLKATSHAALYSMEEALAILQEFREDIMKMITFGVAITCHKVYKSSVLLLLLSSDLGQILKSAGN